jgi:hypothetical protein
MQVQDITLCNHQADRFAEDVANGFLVFKSSDTTTLVSVPLGATPFRTAGDGYVTLNAPLSATITALGRTTYAEFQRTDHTLVSTCTVRPTSEGNGDIRLSTTDFTPGTTLQIDTLVYTVPP